MSVPTDGLPAQPCAFIAPRLWFHPIACCKITHPILSSRHDFSQATSKPSLSTHRLPITLRYLTEISDMSFLNIPRDPEEWSTTTDDPILTPEPSEVGGPCGNDFQTLLFAALFVLFVLLLLDSFLDFILSLFTSAMSGASSIASLSSLPQLAQMSRISMSESFCG